MIDWSAVDRNGFVVSLPTEEAVDSFLRELSEEYPQLHMPQPTVVRNIKHYKDRAAMYIGEHGLRSDLHWEYCYYEWFKSHMPYSKAEFFEYQPTTLDLGDIESDPAFDLCLLFSNEEVST